MIACSAYRIRAGGRFCCKSVAAFDVHPQAQPRSKSVRQTGQARLQRKGRVKRQCKAPVGEVWHSAEGSSTFVYRLFVDGVDLGTATASVTIGATSTVLSTTTDDVAFSGAAFVGVVASLGITTDDIIFSGGASVSPICTLSATTADAMISGSTDQRISGSASVSFGTEYWSMPDQVLRMWSEITSPI